MILPQVQTIRDILDSDAICVVTKENTFSKTLDLLGKILTEIPIYRLSCDMTEAAVKTSYNGMKV